MENWATYKKEEIEGIWYVLEDDEIKHETETEEKADEFIKSKILEMGKNKNPELDKEKKVANNLENLLFNLEDRDEKRGKILNGVEDLKPEGKRMNFSTVQADAESEAKEVLQSVVKFYLDQDLINEEEYITAKQRVDELTLSNILFSLKTAQYAIIKLLEEIDLGNTHPRIFESLAQLQNQMMNIVKHQTAYVVTMQEGYKQIKHDSETISSKALKGSSTKKLMETSTGVKARGTKELMNNLDATEVEFEDVKEDEDKMTDAKNRPDAPEYAKIKKVDRKEDKYEIDEEQF